MKTKILLLSILMLPCLSSCSQDFNKLDKADVDEKRVEIAKVFATRYLTLLKDGSYYQFTDGAVDALKNHLTEENQKASYQQMKSQFGDFKSLEYAETWAQKGNDSIYIVRLKADFERSKKKLEVRVVLDESNRIAGFWIKPWSDMLN